MRGKKQLRRIKNGCPTGVLDSHFCLKVVWGGLNMLVALIEFHIVDILFDALLLTSWANH